MISALHSWLFCLRGQITTFMFKNSCLIFLSSIGLICSSVFAEPTELTLRLKWFHQFQFAGYYAAAEKGFYAEEGLSVKILERDPSLSPIDEVVNGSIDFAISDSSLILKRLNGAPVVALAVIMQSSPLILMSLADSQISSPLDLYGKRIMYQQNVDDAMIMEVLNEYNITKNDFIFVPHNFDDDALLNDQTDVMSAYITDQPFIYRANGHQVNIINPANYGVDFYGDNLFTSEKLFSHQQQQVLAFRRASLKGWQYALENSDEVIDWIINRYGSKKSKQALIYEAALTKRMIKPKLIDIGNINPSRFRRISQIYQEKGLAPNTSNLNGLYYLDYLKKPHQLETTVLIISIGLVIVLAILLMVLFINNRLKLAVQQRTDKLAETNRRLKKLIGFVAHDLRNPLGAILSFSKMGRNPKYQDKLPHVLESMEKAAAKGLELVKSALEATALGTGKYELEISTFDFSELVDASIDNFKEIAEGKELHFEVDKTLGLWVEADVHRITQVLDNVILNAIKYAPEKSEIKIECEPTGSRIRFSCLNQIPKNYRVEVEEESLYKSFGFGIEIIREILELHQANLEFESQDKTFEVRFGLAIPKK